MRMVLVALVTFATASVVDVRPVSAQEKPWCAQLYDRGGDGGRICGYISWEQCGATTGLQDGFCLPNPAYRAVLVEAPARHRKHRQGHAS
jgi:hypothetical protein